MLWQHRVGLTCCCACIADSVTQEQPQEQTNTAIAAEVECVIQELMIPMPIAPAVGVFPFLMLNSPAWPCVACYKLCISFCMLGVGSHRKLRAVDFCSQHLIAMF